MRVTLKLILAVLLCTIIGAGVAFSAGARQANVNRLSIAGGPVGGAYYAVSLGLADLLMNENQGMHIDVITTGGAPDNAFFVGQGDHDFGLATGDTILDAFEGTGPFTGRRQNDLRILFSGVAGGAFHLITHERITSIEELRGRRIAMGPEGHIATTIALMVFRQYGINPGDFIPSFLSLADGLSALSDGQVEAALATGAFPLGAVQELAANVNFNYRIHSFSRSAVDTIIRENPTFGATVIPRGTYNRQNEDVLTIGTTNYMITNSRVPENVVYQVLETIFDNLETVHRGHPSARVITLEGAAVELIPLHEGARRFYRGRGIIR
jgi:hypothetical protein